MRVFLLSIVIFALSPLSHAQDIHFGPIAGLSFPDLKFSNYSNQGLIEEIRSNPGSGYHLGAWGRVSILGFYVQGEFLYHSLNGKLVVEETNGEEYSGTYQIRRLDLPVHAGFRLGPVGVFAGPVFTTHLNPDQGVFDGINNDFTVGGNAGVQVLLGKFLLQGRYEFSIKEYQGDIRFNTSSGEKVIQTDSRSPIFILSVGYDLF
ncbi:MAG: hypothetical protein LPK46_11275 [Bacteroidota bacterium]|nr:hypothetical protein [Bacteroidota bacterium]MDX5506706.1 hypothetical protein [Bacteroidota bacterium]